MLRMLCSLPRSLLESHTRVVLDLRSVTTGSNPPQPLDQRTGSGAEQAVTPQMREEAAVHPWSQQEPGRGPSFRAVSHLAWRYSSPKPVSVRTCGSDPDE